MVKTREEVALQAHQAAGTKGPLALTERSEHVCICNEGDIIKHITIVSIFFLNDSLMKLLYNFIYQHFGTYNKNVR